MTDRLTAGDLLPVYSARLFDGSAPYDATDADQVRVRGWVNGVLIFDRLATTVTADGWVSMDWQDGDTDEPGPLKSKVVALKAGFKPSTFPPTGFLVTQISPASP